MSNRTIKTSSASTTKTKTLATPKTGKSAQSLSKKSKRGGNSQSVDVTPEERNRLIAEAAYYRAEQHGFNPESQVDDWLAAEAEVDTMLKNITHQIDAEQAH